MKRRDFLITSAAASLAAPALAQGNARVLRFVPEGNLQSPDPVWTTTTVAANHAMMIYDQLYARDAKFMPQPQMVAGHELSDDKLTWTFTLRDGLVFHDGEKVRAIDCVASVNRWARRNPLGQKLVEVSHEMTALDDKRFQVRLKKPFPLILNAFATGPFMMPERVAKTDPFQQITEFVGCGPFRFLRDEWVTGVQAIYTKFDGYVSRQEPSSFVAGGKVAHLDRIEWKVMPDPATSAGALSNGEVDWWQNPPPDLIPMLRQARGVRAAINDSVGAVAMLRPNFLHPPFKDNPKLVQAIMAVTDQSDFMTAVAGDEKEMFHVPSGVFTPGQPMANDAGMEVFTGPRDMNRAKQLVKESGYANEPIVLMSPSDYPHLAAMAQVAADVMKRLGLNVQYTSMDWGTLVQRRTSKEPSDKGGWNAFVTTWAGLSVNDPANHSPIRGTGANGWFGWPTSPKLEALREQWFDAPDFAAQKAACEQIQRTVFEEGTFVVLGQYFSPTAFRNNVVDIVPSSIPIFWNVRKT